MLNEFVLILFKNVDIVNKHKQTYFLTHFRFCLVMRTVDVVFYHSLVIYILLDYILLNNSNIFYISSEHVWK